MTGQPNRSGGARVGAGAKKKLAVIDKSLPTTITIGGKSFPVKEIELSKREIILKTIGGIEVLISQIQFT